MKEVTMTIYVQSIVADEGSIVLFGGIDDEGDYHVFAVDHHCAQDLADALAADDEPVVEVEAWQVIGS